MSKIKLILSILFTVLLFSAATGHVYADQSDMHQNYINGSVDGLFHPNDTLSRAEVAQMICNLRPDIGSGEMSFSDVPDGAWYSGCVKKLASFGIMSGYSDGTFKPMKDVTRAEFVMILSALSSEGAQACSTSFSDVSATHWAYSAISLAESKGWVKGSHGLFRPDDSMTRAEAVTAINRFLGRVPDKASIDKDPTARYFPDVSPEKWYYYDIMEASVAHTASVTPSGEIWTGITRYPTILPDGFAVISGSVRLIRSGCFVYEEASGEYCGVPFSSDEYGNVTVPDGALPLSGGVVCMIKDGEITTDDGLYDTPSGLYCIIDGEIITDRYFETLYFGPDGKYTTKNADIDDYIDGIILSVTSPADDPLDKLRACYDYIYDNVYYRANNRHVPRGASPDEWTEEYMLRLIDTGKGNCYCYASLMYYLARRIGFTSATAVSGGVTPDNLDHGWITVSIDGETLLLDPELDSADGEYKGSVYLVTYKDAPFHYFP